MKGSMRLGVIYDVPVFWHGSWPFVLGLVIFLLATGAAAELHGEQGTLIPWLAAGGVGLGIFASVLLHEAAHLFAAARHHLFIERVTLYPFGGVPVLARTVTTRRAGLVYAAAGPASSLLAGILLLTLTTITNIGPTLLWIGLFNLLLGLANLLPAVPLDGPRLWQSLAGKRSSVLSLHLLSFVLGKFLAVALVWIGGGVTLVTRAPDGLSLVLLGALMLWADEGSLSEVDEQPSRRRTWHQLPDTLSQRNGNGRADWRTGMPPKEKILERNIDGI